MDQHAIFLVNAFQIMAGDDSMNSLNNQQLLSNIEASRRRPSSTICGSSPNPFGDRLSIELHRTRGSQRRTRCWRTFRRPVSEFEPGLPGRVRTEPAVRRSQSSSGDPDGSSVALAD